MYFVASFSENLKYTPNTTAIIFHDYVYVFGNIYKNWVEG